MDQAERDCANFDTRKRKRGRGRGSERESMNEIYHDEIHT